MLHGLKANAIPFGKRVKASASKPRMTDGSAGRRRHAGKLAIGLRQGLRSGVSHAEALVRSIEQSAVAANTPARR
jgi:hypothetical protein